MSPDPTSSSTGRPLRDPYAEALFPVVIHRLNNATQVLTTLGSALSADLDELLAGLSDDLAGAARTVDELGWLLGVLASAGGADLLLERRAASGLAVVVRATGEALLREGRGLGSAPRELPALRPDAGEGWQVPWAIGATLWCAGRGLPPEGTLAWTLDRLEPVGEWRLACDLPPDAEPPGLAALAGRIADELPPAALTRTASGVELRLPADALG